MKAVAISFFHKATFDLRVYQTLLSSRNITYVPDMMAMSKLRRTTFSTIKVKMRTINEM
jgi:hypothetical protein